MYSDNPMDTSSLIIHRFDVETARGKFEEITSILKGESAWKLWHRFDVDLTFKIDEILMSSPRGFSYVVSTSNRRNFCTRCFHSIIFQHFLLLEPILNYSGIMLSHWNFNDIDVMTDFGTAGTISFGIIATMQIQNNYNRDHNANIYN